MADKKDIHIRKRPQFFEANARKALENAVLRPGLKEWVRTMGPISRMWLESGWATEDAAKGLPQPSAQYERIASIYNGCMLQALGGTPTLGQFRARMHEHEEKLPAVLRDAIPELTGAQADALTKICHTYFNSLVVGHLVIRLEQPDPTPKR